MRRPDLALAVMSSTVDLSVAVTTYNRWDRVPGAIQSVIDQEPRPSQILLVDDCSKDPPPEELKSWMDEVGVDYIRHHENRGLAAARNTAVEAAKAKYFSFCDDDDRWAPGFVEQCIKLLKQYSNVSAIALYPASSDAKPCATTLLLEEMFLNGFTPPVASQVYSSDLIKRIGGYNSLVRTGVDHDLWVQLLPANPRFAIGFGNYVAVDDSPDADRMTTREAERRSAIAASLELWRPTITRQLGADFFEHFERSYNYYLDSKFFRQACSRRDFPDIVNRLLRHPNVRKYVVSHAVKRFQSRSRPGAFLPFRP